MNVGDRENDHTDPERDQGACDANVVGYWTVGFGRRSVAILDQRHGLRFPLPDQPLNAGYVKRQERLRCRSFNRYAVRRRCSAFYSDVVQPPVGTRLVVGFPRGGGGAYAHGNGFVPVKTRPDNEESTQLKTCLDVARILLLFWEKVEGSGVGGGEKMYHYVGQRRAAWVVTVWLAADAVRCSQKNESWEGLASGAR
jgi:hypothetical protein